MDCHECGRLCEKCRKGVMLKCTWCSGFFCSIHEPVNPGNTKIFCDWCRNAGRRTRDLYWFGSTFLEQWILYWLWGKVTSLVLLIYGEHVLGVLESVYRLADHSLCRSPEFTHFMSCDHKYTHIIWFPTLPLSRMNSISHDPVTRISMYFNIRDLDTVIRIFHWRFPSWI